MDNKENMDIIFYKNTFVKKQNTYTWCGIVDKNGRMLKNYMPDVLPDFINHITECTQAASDMIIDDTFYKFGIHKQFHKFFKLVSPSLYMEYLYPVHKERGRYKNESIYLYGTWFDAFYNIENFFKGVLWMFTTLNNLNNYLPYIDRVRVLRVNHDFVEMFGENELEPYSLDDIIQNKFNKLDEIKSPESEQLKKISENKRSKRIERKQEVWANGMKIFKIDEEQEKYKNMELPEIYDYHFEIYRKMGNGKTQIKKPLNTIHYANAEERTVNKKRINLVLR